MTSNFALQFPLFSLVIPAYNEEERIRPILDSLEDYLPQMLELIVVCDGVDRTAEIANSYKGNIKVIQFSERIGKGKAIIEGFKVATGDVVGFVDADGSVSLSEILRIASKVTEQSPVVIGSRWMRNSRIMTPEPILNRFASRVFHYLTFLILGIREKDTQCGLKFFHRSVINVIVPKIRIYGWMIDVALLYHSKLMGLKIEEVGITWRHQRHSKFPLFRAAPLMLFTLIGLKLTHSKLLGEKFRSLSVIANEMTPF